MPFDLDEFLQSARLGRYRAPQPETQPEPVARPKVSPVAIVPAPVSAEPLPPPELGPADAPRLLAELEQAAAMLCGTRISVVSPALAQLGFLVSTAYFVPAMDAEVQAEARAALPAALDDVEDLLEACALIAR